RKTGRAWGDAAGAVATLVPSLREIAGPCRRQAPPVAPVVLRTGPRAGPGVAGQTVPPDREVAEPGRQVRPGTRHRPGRGRPCLPAGAESVEREHSPWERQRQRTR